MLLAACKDDDPAPSTTDQQIAGRNATPYAEASESGDNTSANAENTDYVLNTEGIIISGSFEASSPSTDNYKFNTATFSKVGVQVFVSNAAETEEAHKTTIALDSFVNDGLSSLTGSGYFIRASVTPAKDFVISIFTAQCCCRRDVVQNLNEAEG